MATKLDKTLKREIQVDGQPYMLTISPEGLFLAQKGRRKGVTLQWQALVNGDAALATALNASVEAGQEEAGQEGLVQPAKDN